MTNLTDIFDQIIVINIVERTDRKRLITWDLKRVGIDVTSDSSIDFFPAIVPSGKGGFPSCGAKGCFMSHLEVLRKALESGCQNILVLEDDAKFLPNCNGVFPQIKERLESQPWDMFYLGHYIEFIEQKKWRPEIYKEAIQCTHAVAFNQTVLKEVVGFLELVISRNPGDPLGGPMHVDGAYSTFREQNPEVLTLLSNPSLCTQRSSRSDITSSGWKKIPVLRQLVDWAYYAKSSMQ